MADVLTLADMPDLSDWRLAPLWTLEQAALLRGELTLFYASLILRNIF